MKGRGSEIDGRDLDRSTPADQALLMLRGLRGVLRELGAAGDVDAAAVAATLGMAEEYFATRLIRRAVSRAVAERQAAKARRRRKAHR